MNVDVCDPVRLGRGASQRLNLNSLTRTLVHNYGILAAASLFIVGTLLVLITMVYMVQRTVADYYTFMTRSSSAQRKSANMDDETYGSQTEREAYKRSKERNEYGRIQSRMAYIKSLYKGYNREMGSYTRNILDREPDDIIDERILNREADDYNYNIHR